MDKGHAIKVPLASASGETRGGGDHCGAGKWGLVQKDKEGGDKMGTIIRRRFKKRIKGSARKNFGNEKNTKKKTIHRNNQTK